MWSKLSGTFAFHRKVIEVGNEGAGAWARMLSYASENLTGGKVSRAVGLQIAGSAELLDRLVAIRLLDQAGSDYQIHDFGDCNPTGEELAARLADLRAKRAEAGRRGGQASWAPGGGRRDRQSQQSQQNVSKLPGRKVSKVSKVSKNISQKSATSPSGDGESVLRTDSRSTDVSLESEALRADLSQVEGFDEPAKPPALEQAVGSDQADPDAHKPGARFARQARRSP